MKTTIEHLASPRFEVIADYPNNDFGSVGTILDRDWSHYPDDDETKEPIWRISDFPHLFRTLQWWEKRTEEEMPRYLKQTGYVDTFDLPVPDVYIEVTYHFKHHSENWRNDSFKVFTSRDLIDKSSDYSAWEPCSEEEYLTNKK